MRTWDWCLCFGKARVALLGGCLAALTTQAKKRSLDRRRGSWLLGHSQGLRSSPKPQFLRQVILTLIRPMLPICPFLIGNLRRYLQTNRLIGRWAILTLGLSLAAWPDQMIAWSGQSLAYVTSTGGISVIDTSENKVVDLIPGPSLPTAVSLNGKHLYAFGPSSSDLVFNISVIDTGDDEVVATIPLDVALISTGVSLNTNSSAIAVTPNGKQLYVTTGLCSSNNLDCGHPEAVYFAFWIIDTGTNKVVAASPGKGFVPGIVFRPNGKIAYFANWDSDVVVPQVLVFNNGSAGSTITLPTYGEDNAITITPDGRRLYVPYVLYNGTPDFPEIVEVIETATNTVMQSIVVESASSANTVDGIAMSPKGRFAYVSNLGSNSVSVLDTASNTIVKTVSVGTSPGSIAVTPDGSYVYVSNQGSNSVSVIKAAGDTVVATIPVTTPGAISISRSRHDQGGDSQ
jgi:YVTN family beta-propeller protein